MKNIVCILIICILCIVILYFTNPVIENMEDINNGITFIDSDGNPYMPDNIYTSNLSKYDPYNEKYYKDKENTNIGDCIYGEKILHNWDNKGKYSYKCVNTSILCTKENEDMYYYRYNKNKKGLKLPNKLKCCGTLKEDIVNGKVICVKPNDPSDSIESTCGDGFQKIGGKCTRIPTNIPTPNPTPTNDNNDTNLRIATFNILTSYGDACGVIWENRKKHVLDNIINNRLDIIILQEVTNDAKKYIQDNSQGYVFLNNGGNMVYEDDGENIDPISRDDKVYIVYNSNTVEPIIFDSNTQEGLFKDVVSSEDNKNDECKYDRIGRPYVYSLFKRKTDGKQFLVYGTHLPRKDCNKTQINTINVIVEHIKLYINDGIPIIIGADWNPYYSENYISYKELVTKLNNLETIPEDNTFSVDTSHEKTKYGKDKDGNCINDPHSIYDTFVTNDKVKIEEINVYGENTISDHKMVILDCTI